VSDKRAVLNVARAINALPEQRLLTVFTPVEGLGGSTKRILTTISRETAVNIISDLGGVDVSDDDCCRSGFGICFPLMSGGEIRWFFVETRQDFCPFCQGAKTVRNEADFEIVSEECWVCDGVGRILTAPLPQRPKKTELVA